MKNLTTLFSFIVLVASCGISQDSIQAFDSSVEDSLTELTVHIEGLKSDEGKLMVALYDSSDKWLKDNIKGKEVDIVEGKATVVFTEVPYGIYAISSFHDKDSDRRLKTGVFGIPTEPYASSRGAVGRFGPPKWEDAKFELNAGTSEEVIKF